MLQIPVLYAVNSRQLLRELETALSKEEKRNLKKLIGALKHGGLRHFAEKNWMDLDKYLLATPSQRKKKKKWDHQTDYGLLLHYAAWKRLSFGTYMLDILCQDTPETQLMHPGQSYRDMSLLASDLYLKITTESVPYKFPFDE